MASGRMIVNAISTDKRVNQLSCDTSRLAFTWLITFCDCEGRTHGDPAIVRSMLFPRRQDVSIEQMEEYIREWALCKLIYWYEADGDLWIQFANFDKNQPGLRKDREAPSRIPAYVEPNESRSNAGVMPEQVPVKLKEVKLREGDTAATSEGSLTAETVALKIYQGVTGLIDFPSTDRDTAGNRIFKFWVQKKSIAATIEYLKPFFEDWCGRKGKNGKPYNRLGMGWLDWALAGEVPEQVPSNSTGRNRPKLDY